MSCVVVLHVPTPIKVNGNSRDSEGIVEQSFFVSESVVCFKKLGSSYTLHGMMIPKYRGRHGSNVHGRKSMIRESLGDIFIGRVFRRGIIHGR